MSRKNVGDLAVGQAVRVREHEDADLMQHEWRIVGFPSRRKARLVAADGNAEAVVDLFALCPVGDQA